MDSQDVPRVVLDTNALLDWLVFRHPACQAWEGWFREGRVQWVASSTLQDEWLHVLSRGVGARYQPDSQTLLGAWSALPKLLPPPSVPARVPRCSDADDQKFVDLAVGAQARWLVTRDKAVLKLKRRLAAWGVEPVTPERWTADLSSAR